MSDQTVKLTYWMEKDRFSVPTLGSPFQIVYGQSTLNSILNLVIFKTFINSRVSRSSTTDLGDTEGLWIRFTQEVGQK